MIWEIYWKGIARRVCLLTKFLKCFLFEFLKASSKVCGRKLPIEIVLYNTCPGHQIFLGNPCVAVHPRWTCMLGAYFGCFPVVKKMFQRLQDVYTTSRKRLIGVGATSRVYLVIEDLNHRCCPAEVWGRFLWYAWIL